MKEMIAYCGLPCHTCPIHLAAREENKEQQAIMRVHIARVCNEKYGTRYGPEDITDCDGCRAEQGRLFRASQACKIRTCAQQKRLENCAYCTDYICDKLDAFLAAEPDAKTRLAEIRSNIP